MAEIRGCGVEERTSANLQNFLRKSSKQFDKFDTIDGSLYENCISQEKGLMPRKCVCVALEAILPWSHSVAQPK